MIVHIFDDSQWYVDKPTNVTYEIENRQDCVGMPKKEGVVLYVSHPKYGGRTEGLVRFTMTPVEAHKLAQLLELYAKALAGKREPKDSGTQ